MSEIGEILSLDGERAEALIAKIKKVWGSGKFLFKRESLSSDADKTLFIIDISKWSASQLKNLGRLFVGLTSDEIESIAEDAFDDVVDLLGELDLSRDQLQAGINLAKKVIVFVIVDVFVICIFRFGATSKRLRRRISNAWAICSRRSRLTTLPT